MEITDFFSKRGWICKLILLAYLIPATKCFAIDQAPTSSLEFTVTNGECSPAASSVAAGRVAIVVTLSSPKAQSVSLVTTGPETKHLFEHTQIGTTETWSIMLSLPAGSYQLINSTGTSKCSVTVN
jgi:hypothetical protein